LKAAFYTLGCKVNQTETEALAGTFRAGGYSIVPFEDRADIYVINTCTVTNMGDRKSRQIIRRAVKTNPEALVVVMGCYAQVAAEEVVRIPGVDLVLGTQDRGEILQLIAQAREAQAPLNLVRDIWRERVEFEELPRLEAESRVRATLKIQEGCNQFCTYCIIPYARGPVRSRNPEKAFQEASSLVEAGYREIVLTGIHTGAYGVDLGIDLNYLVARLAKLPGLKRLRLSSIESVEITPELLQTFAENPNMCPHLHLPLQSGSDHILAQMKRPYSTAEFEAVVNQVRSVLPGVAITTDVIVGFPGEDEKEHRDSLEFARRVGFAGIHVFKYSPRTGTPAAGFAHQVEGALKEQRSKDFLNLTNESWRTYASGFLGSSMEVLAEHSVGDNLWEGHTPNYLRVRFKQSGDLRGELLDVQLDRLSREYVSGYCR